MKRQRKRNKSPSKKKKLKSLIRKESKLSQKKSQKHLTTKKKKPYLRDSEPLHTSDFRYEIQQKQKLKKKKGSKYVKNFRWVTIEQRQFRTNTETRIYVVHKRTGQKRLRAFGKFNKIPIYGYHPDLYSKGKEL